MTASRFATLPGSAGGRALVSQRGKDYMRRIASEGGHTTVSRYGIGYMAQIGSAGALSRFAKLAKKGRINMTPSPSQALSDAPEGSDKQEIIEHLLNRSLITNAEAKSMMNFSLEQVQAIYDTSVARKNVTLNELQDLNPLCAECGKTMHSQIELERGWCDSHLSLREADSHLDDYGDDDDYDCPY